MPKKLKYKVPEGSTHVVIGFNEKTNKLKLSWVKGNKEEKPTEEENGKSFMDHMKEFFDVSNESDEDEGEEVE